MLLPGIWNLYEESRRLINSFTKITHGKKEFAEDAVVVTSESTAVEVSNDVGNTFVQVCKKNLKDAEAQVEHMAGLCKYVDLVIKSNNSRRVNNYSRLKNDFGSLSLDDLKHDLET